MEQTTMQFKFTSARRPRLLYSCWYADRHTCNRGSAYQQQSCVHGVISRKTTLDLACRPNIECFGRISTVINKRY